MTENQRRQFLKLVGVSLAGVAGMGVLPGVSRTEPADTTEIRNPTRKIIVERLKKLAESDIPEDLLMSGADCYDMAEPLPKEKKPCPECERMMKVDEMEEILRAYKVPLKRIQDQGLDAKLIFPEYCPTCGFGLDEEIILEIKYPDHPDPVQVKPERHPKLKILLDEPSDLELMALFLQGKDRYPAAWDTEGALKWKVKQLEKLFGVAEPND